MRLDLGCRDPRRKRSRARPERNGMRRQQGGLPAIDGEVEPRLVPAYELGIDAREQAAIEQGTMLLALRQIDAVALAERIQAAGRAGVAATRERQRIMAPSMKESMSSASSAKRGLSRRNSNDSPCTSNAA